jgi:hypothetical protein
MLAWLVTALTDYCMLLALGNGLDGQLLLRRSLL